MNRLLFFLIPTAIVATLFVGCGNTRRFASAPTRVPTVANDNTSNQSSDQSPDSERGRVLFHGEVASPPAGFVKCTTCHYTEADKGVLVGPNMDGIAERAGTRIPDMDAHEYLRRSITTHDEFIVDGFEAGVMKSIVGDDFGSILPPQDIDNLVAYLMTLEEGASANQVQTSSPTASSAPVALTTVPTPDPGMVVPAGTDGYVQVAADGWSFQPPDSWETMSFTGKITTQPPQADFQGGPVIAMKAGTMDELNMPNVKTSKITTTDGFFDIMFERFQKETYGITITNIVEREIGGAPGRVATFAGWGFGDVESDLAGQLAIALVDTTQPFVMIGLASPADAWTVGPAFNAILSSVRFGAVYEETAQGESGGYSEHQALNSIVATQLPAHGTMQMAEPDRDKGPRFSCVHCHVTHEVLMRHESNPSCATCHSGTSYQRHCVDCHSIHSVKITHEPDNPGCASCHVAGIPGDGVDIQRAAVIFLSYFFHEI